MLNWKRIQNAILWIIGEEWNADVKKFLTDHGALLGTAHYPTRRSDFYMMAPDEKGIFNSHSQH